MPRTAANLMWADALAIVARADRLHREFFRPAPSGWEPPVDLLETADELILGAALPGVRATDVELVIAGGELPSSAPGAFPPYRAAQGSIAWSCPMAISNAASRCRPAPMSCHGGSSWTAA